MARFIIHSALKYPQQAATPTHLIIFVIASLAVHFSGAFLLENRFGGQTPVEQRRLTFSIVERGSVVARKKPVRQQTARKMAAQTGVESSPSNTPDVSETNASEIAYTSPEQVDELASALEVPALPTPTTSVQEAGTAILVIYVGTDGTPDFVEVEQSSFPEDYTNLLAQHFKMARFKPAILSGVPVSSWTRIEVDLEETNSLDHSQPLGTLSDNGVQEPRT